MVLNNILPTIRDNRVAEFTVNVYTITPEGKIDLAYV